MSMILTKFIYDLFGKPQPNRTDLDEDLDRLFFNKDSVSTPSHLVQWDDRDQLGPLQSEVVSHWLKRKFEPTLVLMLFDHQENYDKIKDELMKFLNYASALDRNFRPSYLDHHSRQRIRELSFDYFDEERFTLKNSVSRLKRTLTFLSQHLEKNSPDNSTLLNTEAYTQADILLYNYLKRIIVGKCKDFGLRSHIKLCDHLVKFMKRYEALNPLVSKACEDDTIVEPTLIDDIVKPAAFAIGIISFFLWRINRR